jgi:hypothetical protein
MRDLALSLAVPFGQANLLAEKPDLRTFEDTRAGLSIPGQEVRAQPIVCRCAGTLSDISFAPAGGILGTSGFGTTAQALQSLANLEDTSCFAWAEGKV